MITKTVVRPYKGTDQWEADVFMLVNGKEVRRRWRSPMPSKLATERWAREKAKGFLADLTSSPAPAEEKEAPPPPKPTTLLFKDYATLWMSDYVVANRHSPATFEHRQKTLTRDLLPELGDLPIDQIGPTHFQKLRKDRTHLDATTVNKVCDQLTTMLHTAAEWKLIPGSPRIKRLKPNPKEMPCLTPEEGERLVETAFEFGAKYHLAALLGVDGGLRNSEIIGLRWIDVDFAKNRITVRNRIWRGQEGPPKHKRTRKVPLTTRLRDALMAMPRKAKHVLLTFKGTFIQTSQTLIDWFKPIWAKAQVPRGIHILRHTFATDSLSAGVSAKTVQSMMGHLSLATTEKYLHNARDRDLEEAAVALEKSRRPRDWRNAGDDPEGP